MEKCRFSPSTENRKSISRKQIFLNSQKEGATCFLFGGTEINLPGIRHLLLVYDNGEKHPLAMTKREVLEIFSRTDDFLTPDRVWLGFGRKLDRRSVYSYLLRLKRQGLLETGTKRESVTVSANVDCGSISAMNSPRPH